MVKAWRRWTIRKWWHVFTKLLNQSGSNTCSVRDSCVQCGTRDQYDRLTCKHSLRNQYIVQKIDAIVAEMVSWGRLS